MKKAYVITVISFALSFVVIFSTFGYAAYSRDKVTIKEDILYGDPAKAEGIEVKYYTNLNRGNIYWEHNLKLGKDFSYTSKYGYDTYNIDRNKMYEGEFSADPIINFSSSSNGSIDFNDIGPGISKADYTMFKDMEKECKPGETLTKTIRLSDYWDYFYFDMSYWFLDMETASEKISEYINLKVPDDLYVECYVKKDEEGNMYEVSMSEIENENKSFLYYGRGIFLDDGLYFMVIENEKIHDNKIYVVPNRVDEYRENLFDENKIYTIDISENMEPGSYSIYSSYDKEYLYLSRISSKAANIFKIDKTGKIIDEIQLSYNRDLGLGNLIVKDGYIIILFDQYEFAVIEDKDEKMKLAMEGSFGIHKWNNLYYGEFSYNGEKLVSVIDDERYDNCNKYVLVHSKNGVEFLGKYTYMIKNEDNSSNFYDLNMYNSNRVDIKIN